MQMKVGPPDYKDLGMWRIKQLSDSLRDKRGMEELADPEIGPDVKYVLGTRNIELVQNYLRRPITIAEYRELRFKLLELRLQQTAATAREGSVVGLKKGDTALYVVPASTKGEEQSQESLYLKDSMVDLIG